MPGKYHLFTVAVLAGGVATLGAVAAGRTHKQPGTLVDAVIRNAEGKDVGFLRVEDQDDHTSKVTVVAHGLPPGYHGFHIHNKGVCDPRSRDPKTGSPFFSAGPHFDVDAHSHPEHTGDLPDLLVGADGTGKATAVTDRFGASRLLDGDGSAIIIHALPDNQANIPKRYSATGPDAESLTTGDSGARLACGVISEHSPGGS